MSAEIPPEELAYQQAHFDETRQPMLRGVFAMLFIVATIPAILRLWSRKLAKLKWGLDDWMMVLAVFLHTGVFAINVGSTYYGFGRHDIAVTPDQLRKQAIENNFIGNLWYTTAWPAIKASILLLYRRIFIKPWFQVVNYFMLGVLACYVISTVLVDIFTCTPIRKFWDPTVKGHCIDTLRLYWGTAGLNVAIDVIILLMPQPIVWSTAMPIKYKLALSGVFALGTLAVIASVMRIVTAFQTNAFDVNWSYIPLNVWTAAELALSLICANLPLILPATRRIRSSYSDLFSSRHSDSFVSEEGNTVTNSNGEKVKKDGTTIKTRVPRRKGSGGGGGLLGLTPRHKEARIQSDASAQGTQGSGIGMVRLDKDHQQRTIDEEQGLSDLPEGAIGVERDIEWKESDRGSTATKEKA